MTRYRDLTAAQGWKGFGVAAALALAGILAHAGVMQDPSRVSAAAHSGWIQQLSVDSHKGIVVYGRPDTYVPPPQSYMDFTQLTLTKWAYYFAPWMSGYSRFHKLVGGAFFVVVYALSLLALFRSSRWKVALLLALFIASFSLFHAVQQIDYDHRYRLPILPALCIFAVLGIETLVRPRR